MTKLLLMGQMLSSQEVGPEQRKVDAVAKERGPMTPGEVRSFWYL